MAAAFAAALSLNDQPAIAHEHAYAQEGSGGFFGASRSGTGATLASTMSIKVPASLRIGLDYGRRYGPKAPSALRGDLHRGIDFVARPGEPVVSAGDGTVVHRSYDSDVGGHVIVRISPSGRTLAAADGALFIHLVHLAPNIIVREGQAIRAGDVLGFVEHARYLRYASGDHVHLQVTAGQNIQSRAIDPHQLWAGGPGIVSCWRPAGHVPARPGSLVAPLSC